MPPDDLPDLIKRWEGVDSRIILILTAAKLDSHIEEHAVIKRRVYTSISLALMAFGAVLLELAIRILRGG